MERKTVLVTGANRGIGKEIARQLATLDWKVIVAARNESQAKEVAATLGNHALGIPLDVTNSESIQHACREVSQAVSTLDLLVNNAGIIGNHPMRSFDMNEIESVMDTNFFGAIRMVKHFMPLLSKSDDPRIINVSSGMGELASLEEGGYAGYRLSKTALNAFTILLSAEVRSGMKVFAICPGWVKTDMGGSSAPRPVAKGAETAVWLATDRKPQSGKFYRDKKVIPW